MQKLGLSPLDSEEGSMEYHEPGIMGRQGSVPHSGGEGGWAEGGGSAGEPALPLRAKSSGEGEVGAFLK